MDAPGHRMRWIAAMQLQNAGVHSMEYAEEIIRRYDATNPLVLAYVSVGIDSMEYRGDREQGTNWGISDFIIAASFEIAELNIQEPLAKVFRSLNNCRRFANKKYSMNLLQLLISGTSLGQSGDVHFSCWKSTPFSRV